MKAVLRVIESFLLDTPILIGLRVVAALFVFFAGVVSIRLRAPFEATVFFAIGMLFVWQAARKWQARSRDIESNGQSPRK